LPLFFVILTIVKAIVIFLKAILIGIAAGFILAFIAGVIGDFVSGVDSNGNHYSSWVWAFYGFPLGAIIGFVGSTLLDLRKK
jgi:hypothetical protein